MTEITTMLQTHFRLQADATELQQLIVTPNKAGPRGNWTLQFQDYVSCLTFFFRYKEIIKINTKTLQFFVQPTDEDDDDVEAFEAALDAMSDDDYSSDDDFYPTTIEIDNF